MNKNTVVCNPSLYKNIISPNNIELNNSYRTKFCSDIQIYKRGNFHPNNLALQKILLSIYNQDKDNGRIIITSSGVSIASLISMSKLFNRILYDKIYPEMIEAYSICTPVVQFDKISQIKKGDLICIESYQLPECINNYDKIKMICDYAHMVGAYVLVDNSVMTGYNWNPFITNCDFCMESLAKNTTGLNNNLLGMLISNQSITTNNIITDRLFEFVRFIGCYPHPIDCYLTMIGIQTLGIRLIKIKQTTNEIEHLLSNHNIKYKSITNAGLLFINRPDNFNIQLLNELKIIQSAGVFGVNYTIIDIMENVPYIRLSIGLEEFEDLKNDIQYLITILTNINLN